MPHEFAEYEDEPQTQSSSRLSGGPPRKHIGVGVLDPDDDISAPPRPRIGFTAFLIIAVLATMILVLFFLNR